jgi:hypothetical protein
MPRVAEEVQDRHLQKYAAELSKVKLATYRYKTGGPTRLGFPGSWLYDRAAG